VESGCLEDADEITGTFVTSGPSGTAAQSTDRPLNVFATAVRK